MLDGVDISYLSVLSRTLNIWTKITQIYKRGEKDGILILNEN